MSSFRVVAVKGGGLSCGREVEKHVWQNKRLTERWGQEQRGPQMIFQQESLRKIIPKIRETEEMKEKKQQHLILEIISH